ncbi:MAG: hypothetical protein NVSMB65_13270 [Chloroflexota bacterium]
MLLPTPDHRTGTVEWFAVQLLAAGTDVVVESPPELIAALYGQACAIASLYQG